MDSFLVVEVLQRGLDIVVNSEVGHMGWGSGVLLLQVWLPDVVQFNLSISDMLLSSDNVLIFSEVGDEIVGGMTLGGLWLPCK